MSAHLEREAVLLQMDRVRYFQLNETGQAIWRGLEDGLSPAGVAERLTERFEVNLEGAIAAVEAFLGRLAAERLVES